MKLIIEPSAEFAGLATTRYQRYVLYRLEQSARTSPFRDLGFGALIVIAIFSISANSEGSYHWWFISIVAFFTVSSICESYFSKAVLIMLRGRIAKMEKTDQSGSGE